MADHPFGARILGCNTCVPKAFSDRSIFNDCVLVVKTMNASSDLKENKKLKRLAASDQRITLLDAKLDRKDLIRLYGCCDILLSLHRAEGFGRILAESLLLGLKVVTTDYSGNKDFCIGGSVYKVSYIKTFVPEGTYTHARGQEWAEPSIDDASQKLLKAVCDLDNEINNSDVSLTTYQDMLWPKSAAERYSQRLSEIKKNCLNSEKINWNNKTCMYHINSEISFEDKQLTPT